MVYRCTLQRLLIVLVGIVLVSSRPLPTQAAAECGWWDATVDKKVPLIEVTPPRIDPQDAKCGALFTISNKTGHTGLSYLGITQQHSLILQAQSGVAEFEWRPSFFGPSNTALIPEIEQTIWVYPINPDKPAKVYIQGTWADTNLLALDLTREIIKTLLDLIPGSCGISKKDMVAQLMKNPSQIEKLVAQVAGAADLLIKGEVYQATQEITRVLPTFAKQAGQVLLGTFKTCVDDEKLITAFDLGGEAAMDALKKQMIAFKITTRVIGYEEPWLFDYLYYQGNLASAELNYHPRVVAPTPLPACVSLSISKREPQDGQVFNSKNMALEWWTDYTLKTGESFDVLVWPEGGRARSLGVGIPEKNGGWTFPINNLYAWSRGKYFWTVRVKASDGSYRSCDSTPFWFMLIEKDVPAPVPPSSSSSSTWSSWSSTWSSW